MASPTSAAAPPQIDYLSKDYTSFCRLMLDRLGLLLPDFTERNPADISQVLIELLAYAADQLSYYQDAVATEAYLGTALQRRSARRHARRLDYSMHDGCNARAFVTLQIDASAEGQVLPRGTQLLTQATDQPFLLSPAQVGPEVLAGSAVFETLYDLPLHAGHGTIPFFAAANVAQLAVGSTQAVLDNSAGLLCLTSGDVLIFEEVCGPLSGDPADADPGHRCAVRLTSVQPTVDAATSRRIVNITWGSDDALPFALVLSASVARGNVVLCDHGLTLAQPESLGTPPQDPTKRFYPMLSQGPVTQQGAILKSGSFIPFDPQGSANSVFGFDLQNAQPAIVLHDASGAVFTPRRDLLSSSGSATDFVVEVEDDKTYLRFGDGVFGKAPASALFASYRVGNGRAGNVGAEALSHLVSFSLPNGQPAPWLSGVRSLRNPMPAQGGTDPQTVAEVRMYAPQAFKLQERAVTLADYAAVAGLYPQVQGVQVTRRFTGSFYTIVLCVQRQGMLPLDDAFQSGLRAFLDDYRMVGQDLQITAPSGVPIALDLIVNAAPNAVRSDVRDAVLSAIGSTRRDAAAGGFFDPNRCTLGQPIYLSQLVNRIMQVTGVEWVEVDFFGLYGGPNLLQSGVLALMPQEMPLLDNDPSTPLRGVLDLSVQGGV